jgi:hypothetical protein
MFSTKSNNKVFGEKLGCTTSQFFLNTCFSTNIIPRVFTIIGAVTPNFLHQQLKNWGVPLPNFLHNNWKIGVYHFPIFYTTTTEKLGSPLPIFYTNQHTTNWKIGVITSNFSTQHNTNQILLGHHSQFFFIILKIKIHILYLYFIIKLGPSTSNFILLYLESSLQILLGLENLKPREKMGIYLNQTCRGVIDHYIIFLE